MNMSEGFDSRDLNLPSPDQDEISIGSPVSDDEPSSVKMCVSTGRSVTRSSTQSRRSSSAFRRIQVGRPSSRHSGLVQIKVKGNAKKQMEREQEDAYSDEENSGSEKESYLRGSCERRVENEHLSVQKIIQYFESKSEGSNNTGSQDVGTTIRQRPNTPSPMSISNRRKSRVSNESSPKSVCDTIYAAAEGCSSAYEGIPDYEQQDVLKTRELDIAGDSFESERDERRFEERTETMGDEVGYSSQSRWSEVQSGAVASSAFYDFNGGAPPTSLLERNLMPANDVTSRYDSESKMAQYLLSYDNKLRLRSEMMRLTSNDFRNYNAENIRKLVKSETEVVDTINAGAIHKNVARDDPFMIPQHREVLDPILQAHVYVTKDVNRIMNQWNSLCNLGQYTASDLVNAPARSPSSEKLGSSWSMSDMNAIDLATSCYPGTTPSYLSKGSKNGEASVHYDDLFMMPERTFRKSVRSDGSNTNAFDCDVKQMYNNEDDNQQSTKKGEKSNGRLSKEKKLELVELIRAAKAPGLQKDMERSQSAKGVKSSSVGGETRSRAGSLVPKNSNPSKLRKEKEENRKQAEDNGLRRGERITAFKPSHTHLLRSSSFHSPGSKYKITSKPSPSSSLNSGKSSFTDADPTRSITFQKHMSGATNLSSKVESSRFPPVSRGSLEVRKENDKPFQTRSKLTAPRQQVSSRTTQEKREVQEKPAHIGNGTALVEANGGLLGRLPATVTDMKRQGLRKGKL